MEEKHRSTCHSIILQIILRIVHLIETWFYLKPFLLRISAYDHIYEHVSIKKRPEVPYWCEFLIKILWFISQFAREYKILTLILLLTRIYHILGYIHKKIIHYIIYKFEQSNYDWNSIQNLKIPEFDWKNDNPKDFYENYVLNPYPCVLRNFEKTNENALKHLSFDELIKNYGNEYVYLTKDGQDGVIGQLKEVENNKVYLHNSEKLFNQFSELRGLLDTSKLEKYFDKMNMKASYTQLFIGRGGTGSPFHCAIAHNMFYMIDGKKQWYFVHPKDTILLHPAYALGRGSAFSFCLYPDQYEEETFPLFKYCPYYSTILNPGDVLWNPALWWHAIKNQTDKTVGIASRWHINGIAGSNYKSMEEDYNINRWHSLINLFLTLESFKFIHNVLKTPKPYAKQHVTLRESTTRYTHLQREAAFKPGVVKFGHRFTF